jgi:hypothetical protein
MGFVREYRYKAGTGLDIMRQAEEKSNGALPLNVRLLDRIARYEALWDGTDLLKAVPIITGMIEGGVCSKQLNAAQRDGWPPSDIYAVITYYLWSREEVEAYLEGRRRLEEAVRRENEARFPPAGVRERLLARRARQT